MPAPRCGLISHLQVYAAASPSRGGGLPRPAPSMSCRGGVAGVQQEVCSAFSETCAPPTWSGRGSPCPVDQLPCLAWPSGLAKVDPPVRDLRRLGLGARRRRDRPCGASISSLVAGRRLAAQVGRQYDRTSAAGARAVPICEPDLLGPHGHHRAVAQHDVRALQSVGEHYLAEPSGAHLRGRCRRRQRSSEHGPADGARNAAEKLQPCQSLHRCAACATVEVQAHQRPAMNPASPRHQSACKAAHPA